MKKNILIVDDHPIVRRGFTQLIDQEPDLKVCGEAENVQEAMQAIADYKPDMVIVDISLKDSNGIDLIKIIADKYEGMPVLVVSMHDESVYAERVVRAGAKGYLMKQEADEVVIAAIRRILKGGLYLSEKINEKILLNLSSHRQKSEDSPVARLSDRELEVFRMIGQGRGTRQIAEALHLSIKTVESYRARIKDKLYLESGNELVLQAILWTQKESGS